MANFIFRLPDIGEGVAEAEIVAWHVKLGDRIDEDQVMVEVMTDKATVEMTSPVTGRVRALHGEVGSFVPVGSPLLEVELEGSDAPPEAAAADKTSPVGPPPTEAPAPAAQPHAPQGVSAAPAQPSVAPAVKLPLRPPAEKPLAAPATRRLAYERGIPLQFVPGTGPGGRITREDVLSYTAHDAPGSPAWAAPRAPRLGVTETKLVGMRRAIAERMQESKRRIPHFGYVEEFDMTELEALRRDLNASKTSAQPRLTLLPFFMRAIVQIVPAFPQVNARYDDEAGVLSVSEGVHIGIAAQTDRGLTVPVVRHAESLNLWESASELARVTQAARDGTASRDMLTGSTITLTSLGALGGISATPVINRPEVAIIGPNKLVDRPMVLNGHIVIRAMMNVSSSFDHRIVDGQDAARFIQALKRVIERPALLFMDQQ
jgi:2-oxoisovalerate dehydrogenase E2 component (dihydrolipoyl transacylase)